MTLNIDNDALSFSEVQKHFALLKADRENSHKTGQWCGRRRQLMTGRLLAVGVPLTALGTAMITAPADCPPEKLMRAEEPSERRFSFARTLASVAPGKDYVEHRGFRFQKLEESDGSGLIIQHADGRSVDTPMPAWRATLDDFGGTVTVFSDHIAPTIKTRMADGTVRNLVMDPSLADEGPLTFAQWHEKQGCPPAIVIHADYKGVIRPAPTTDESRLRLSGILSTRTDDTSLYQATEECFRSADTYSRMVSVVVGQSNWAKDPFLRLPYTSNNGEPVDARTREHLLKKDIAMMAPFVAFEDWRERIRNGPVIRLSRQSHQCMIF